MNISQREGGCVIHETDDSKMITGGLHTFCRTCRAFIIVEPPADKNYDRPNYCPDCKKSPEVDGEKENKQDQKKSVDIPEKAI